MNANYDEKATLLDSLVISLFQGCRHDLPPDLMEVQKSPEKAGKLLSLAFAVLSDPRSMFRHHQAQQMVTFITSFS
jgi:hypothetical protein